MNRFFRLHLPVVLAFIPSVWAVACRLEDPASPVSAVIDSNGAHGITGCAWSGTLRGQNFTGPAGQWRTCTWDGRPQNLRLDRPDTAHCHVSFSGLGAFTYRIERSDDLIAWTNLGAPTGAPTNLELPDTAPAGTTRRFYCAATTAP